MVGMGYVLDSWYLLEMISEIHGPDWEYAYEPEVSSLLYGIVNYVGHIYLWIIC
jgi:hypothetical protein